LPLSSCAQLVSRSLLVEMAGEGSTANRKASAPDTLDIFTERRTCAESQTGAEKNAGMGMLPNVVEEWGRWHANPATAMVLPHSMNSIF
jgi:hypothetical protein